MNLSHLQNLLKKIKKFYGIPENYGKKVRLVEKTVDQFGYLPVPCRVAQEGLKNDEIFAGLERIWAKQKVMEGKRIKGPLNPLERLGYQDSRWMTREQHKIESLSLMGLTDEEEGSVKGNFRHLLIKILTSPCGSPDYKVPATTFYLLPFFKRDMAFRSAYCPLSCEVDPSLQDEKLYRETGIDGETQIQLFIALANLAGHPVLMDILPQTGRFSKTVLAHPECFKWYDLGGMISALLYKIDLMDCAMPKADFPLFGFDSAIKALKEDVQGKPLNVREGEDNLTVAVRTLYHEIFREIMKVEKKAPGGAEGIRAKTLKETIALKFREQKWEEMKARFKLSDTAYELLSHSFEVFLHLHFNLHFERISLSKQQLSRSGQMGIVQRVREAIREKLGREIQEERSITQEEHQGLVEALQKKELWPVGGGCWNSAGHPVFTRMNATDGDAYYTYPVSNHYNYRGYTVDAFAGDMDIIAPWNFVAVEEADAECNLDSHTLSTYLKYCEEIYRRFEPNGFRIDHLDHSADFPTSVNECGNSISYRAPLSVFKAVGEAIGKKDPLFGMFAEYMGWGDRFSPHLYKKYHENGMHLAISTDVVGEFRNNARVMVHEGNEVLEKYNEGKAAPYFSTTRILDNHDRAHPDIAPALSEFTEERALLKWVKCIFLPGGELAHRPTLYIDGNQTLTPNSAFKETFLGCHSLKRGKNDDFFVQFDALFRFSLRETALLMGRASLIEVIDTSSSGAPPNNGISGWIVWPTLSGSPILVVANEWIDDHTLSHSEAGPLHLLMPEGFKIMEEIALPLKIPCLTVQDFLKNVGDIGTRPVEGVQLEMTGKSQRLTIPSLPRNHFKIFRLKKE